MGKASSHRPFVTSSYRVCAAAPRILNCGPMRAALLAALLAAPARADMIPPSGVRVHIESAAVEELRCSRRPFAMESTKAAARGFSRMGDAAGAGDPRFIVLAVAGTILLVPLTVASVPLDLASAPFRRRCEYRLRIDGRLLEWAGRATPHAEVSVEGKNQLTAGDPELENPLFYVARASATSDGSGRFSLSLDGRTGRSRAFDLAWSIRGRPSLTHRLTKRGGRFVLEELDPGLGTGVYEMAPIVISPKRRGGG